jgi:Tfp pilus assembly protein FimV
MFGRALDPERVFGQDVHMRRTRVRRRRAAATALVSLALWVGVPAAAHAFRGAAAAPPPPATTTYVVQPGDTLWAIAVRSAPATDPRVVVDRIDAINGLAGRPLEPGQALLVPTG